MANQVVIPFPGSRFSRAEERGRASNDGRSVDRLSRGTTPLDRVLRERSRWLSRLSTAREVVRAVVETLSYLNEARVRPPLPALPAPRKGR